MFNRTDGMQHETKQRIADGATRITRAEGAPRFDSAATHQSAGKAEEMVALLANRIRSRERHR